MAREEWRDVPGWEGLYQASSLGKVRRIMGFRRVSEGLFEPSSFNEISRYTDRRSGYTQVRLSNGRSKTLMAHAVICAAFHGPKPSPGHEVAHKDGTRDNNCAANLRWATKVENAADRSRHKRDALGSAHKLAKLTEANVHEIRRRHVPKYGNGIALAREFDVTNTLITNIVKRRAWKHI